MSSLSNKIPPVRRGFTFASQWLASVTLFSLVLVVLSLNFNGEFSSQYRILGVISILCSLPIYSLLGAYDKRQDYLTGLARVLSSWVLLLFSLLAISFITKTYNYYSRSFFIYWAVLGGLAQFITYIPLHFISKRHSRKLRSERISVIVGTEDLAKSLATTLEELSHVPLAGFISTDIKKNINNNKLKINGSCYSVLGNLSDLRSILSTKEVRRVYLAVPLEKASIIKDVYIDLLDVNVDVVWVPDFSSIMLLNHSIASINNLPAIYLNESPLTSNPAAMLAKDLLERFISVVGIILISPLLVILAVAVKLSSPGPVLFKQERHGRNGKIIKVMKFRSMKVHDDTQVKQATRSDDRITSVGKFIRRTSLDELPQLFNVVLGEMALVGPRPHAVTHNQYYTDKIEAYMARHRIKPGITGLAQISGCRGETETLDKMQKRIELDLSYINNWSLWLDIKILIRTPFTLFSKEIY